MKREHKFYTEHKKYLDELEAMLEESEEDQGEDDPIMERIARINERLQLIPNSEKIEKFYKLAKRAETMAEMLYYDIEIETNEKFGRIEFSSPNMLVPAPVDPKARKIFAWLIAEANDINVNSEQNEETVHVRLLYELYDEHYAWIDKL